MAGNKSAPVRLGNVRLSHANSSDTVAQSPLEDAILELTEADIAACQSCGSSVAHNNCGKLPTPLCFDGTTLEAAPVRVAGLQLAEPLRAGDAVGRYQILALLAKGGMGAIYKAFDPELRRRVAIKLLNAQASAPELAQEMHTRLRREAQAMARVSHPNVVPVFEIGESRGQVFIVMELVEGNTLARWMEKPRTQRELLTKFIAAGEGLAAAHAKGVVHRDFKPDNVLVGEDGRARVTDFGLARGADGLAEPLAPLDTIGPGMLTPSGAVMGTPAYMSPEQMRGVRADARSDLFAYCTALYEAICGIKPYAASTIYAQLTKIEGERLVWPKNVFVPRWLKHEISRGLSANPVDRHASMAELLTALRNGSLQRLRPMHLVSAAAVALLVAGMLVSLFVRGQGLPDLKSSLTSLNQPAAKSTPVASHPRPSPQRKIRRDTLAPPI